MKTKNSKIEHTDGLSEEARIRRVIIISALFCFLFAGLGYRAFNLQVNQRESLQKVIRLHMTTRFRLYARRGDVFDRKMTPLAISVEADSIFANPRMIRQKERVARLLAPILKIPERKLLLKLAEDRYFIWLKRHATPRQVRAVQELKERKDLKISKALRVVKERQRVYPNKNLASHILGYTDRDGRGLAGVERYFDKLLRGKRQTISLKRDPKGRYIWKPGTVWGAGRSGANVVLTIDKTIQYITEKELAKAVIKAKARRGVAIVMNPHNGDILSLSIYPDFDPNHFRKAPNIVRNNWAISNPYEPGSTLKALSFAATRDLGLMKANERMYCENGRMKIGRYTIRDDHKVGRVTAAHAFMVSSNICTAKLAMRVGKHRLYKYFRNFGLGQKTGVRLPWESRGILHKPKKWADISLANIAFGQGVSVTSLQLISAISAIANGGILYQPRLYLSVEKRDGKLLRRFKKVRVRRVISRSAARMVTRMMEKVVSKEGTANNAAIEGIRVAGKTGTAQKPRKNGRGYGAERIGSFIGFLPANNPKLAILVMIDEPQIEKRYGGTVAAPAWKEIAKASLQQLGYVPKGRIHFVPTPRPKPQAKKEEPKKKDFRTKPSI